MVGIDPQSDGLARAARLGVATTADGIDGLLAHPVCTDLDVIFDATSAKAHLVHAERLAGHRAKLVDLTPAALGPFVVPAVNLEAHRGARVVNMVTCGGQATIPIVAAVARASTTPVVWGEIVASIASKSAGPGSRANIDEFTRTTAKAIEDVGGARRGKAIIVLNPADPPVIMRDTVITVVEGHADEGAIGASVGAMVDDVARYVPGYRMVKAPVYLPKYAGNLDIMTSAALRTGERLVA
jgi:acetaldehyde dehydrogenase